MYNLFTLENQHQVFSLSSSSTTSPLQPSHHIILTQLQLNRRAAPLSPSSSSSHYLLYLINSSTRSPPLLWPQLPLFYLAENTLHFTLHRIPRMDPWQSASAHIPHTIPLLVLPLHSALEWPTHVLITRPIRTGKVLIYFYEPRNNTTHHSRNTIPSSFLPPLCMTY